MSLLCSRNSCSGKQDVDGGGEQVMMGGCGGVTAGMTMRKGPWTEEEDAQLVRFVRLFGERRWDFLAKVSGLRRTGKSCRLRWVNYLHPGLRRGRITADEERLIVDLHAQWGSRWSRIARSLPGRTDNEIKNFWRTRTRKKALEERRSSRTPPGSSSSPSSSSSVTTTTSDDYPGSPNSGGGGAATSLDYSSSSMQEEGSGGDDDVETGELQDASMTTTASQQPQEEHYFYTAAATMDDLWNDNAVADAAASYVIDCWSGGACTAEPPSMPSPVWDYCSDYYSLWKIDDEEYYKKMLDAS